MNPSRQISRSSSSLSAFTHDTPTPCRSAGNFVRRRIELSAGMQLGHHNLRGWNFFAVDVHRVDRNAAAVVDDRDGVVEVDGDFDLVGVSGERFVDGVVDDFIDQVMQSHSPVEPMYIAGRLRTASMPPSTLMESAV